MSEENLWGEIPLEVKIETPVSILKAQATALGKLTKGYLQGRVIPKTVSSNFIYDFRIVAPALSNYTFHLLTVSHDIGLYPVVIRNQMVGLREECENVEAFKTALKEIFQSQPVKDMIVALLSQLIPGVTTPIETERSPS